MAKCLEDLDAFLLQALDISAADLQKLSASELAKMLSNNPSVPEKGIWGWFKKQDLLDAFKDIDNPDAIKGHVIKAFEARVKTLTKRLNDAYDAGDYAKHSKLAKELTKAENELAAAKVKYFVEPPPAPLFADVDSASLGSLSTNELAQMLGQASELPEGTTLYSWLGKEDLIKAINDLKLDPTLVNAVTIKAYKAKVDTLYSRYLKALKNDDKPKMVQLAKQHLKALEDWDAAKVKYGASPLQKPHSAPIHEAVPAPPEPLIVGVDQGKLTYVVDEAKPSGVAYYQDPGTGEVYVGFDIMNEQFNMLVDHFGPGKVQKVGTVSQKIYEEEAAKGMVDAGILPFPSAAPPPPAPALSKLTTEAGQALLDAVDNPDAAIFTSTYNAAFKEAGFHSAGDAGSIYYKWYVKEFKPTKKGANLFADADYKAKQKLFVQAVGEKDPVFLANLEGIEGKYSAAPFKLPEAWGGTPKVTLGKVMYAKDVTAELEAASGLAPAVDQVIPIAHLDEWTYVPGGLPTEQMDYLKATYGDSLQILDGADEELAPFVSVEDFKDFIESSGTGADLSTLTIPADALAPEAPAAAVEMVSKTVPTTTIASGTGKPVGIYGGSIQLPSAEEKILADTLGAKYVTWNPSHPNLKYHGKPTTFNVPHEAPAPVADFQVQTTVVPGPTIEVPYKPYGGKLMVGWDTPKAHIDALQEKFSGWSVAKYSGKTKAMVKADPKSSTFTFEGPGSVQPVVPNPAPLPVADVTDWAVPKLRQAPQSPLINGGAHAKETFVDEFGNEWMGKPVSKGGWAAQGGAPDTAFLAKGEDAGHQILHRIGLQVAPSHVMEMNGKTYHVQKLFQGIKRNGLSGVSPADLTMAQREQLMQHQVGDWLIGNHDSHEGNFLILADDSMVSIDKGQFMKFIGKDVLDTSYKPPGNFGTPYYHGFWKDYEAGKFDVDLHAIDETLDRIDAMSDEEFAALVRPYARGRATVSGLPSSMAKLNEEQLIQAALDRKHQIRAEFDKFRQARARAAGRAFTPAKPKPIPQPTSARQAVSSRIGSEGVPVPVDQTLADQIAQAKVHGAPYYVPGSQVEYGQYLFYEEVRNGKRTLVLHGNLLPEGDQVASATLAGVNPEIAALRASMPVPPPAPVASQFGGAQSFFEIPDVVHDDIVAAAKTLAVHVSDGAYNQATLDKMAAHLDKLKAVKGTGEATYDAQLLAARDYYVKAIEDIKDGVASNMKLSYTLQKQEWVDPAAAEKFQKAQVKWEQDNANVLAKRQEIEQRIASLDTTGGLSGAELRYAQVREANVSNDLTKVVTHAEKPRLGNGQQYVVNTNDGVEIRYSPYSENGAINWKGHLEITAEFDGSVEPLAKITETLERMGLTSRPATAAEMKVTYHEALAAFVKGRQDSSSSPILAVEKNVRSRLAPGMSPEQIADIWEEETVKLLGPQPADYWKPRVGPVASKAGSSGTEGYWPYWYRPAGDRPVDLKAAYGGKIMTHDVLSYEVSEQDIVNTFRTTGVFGGKAERIRLGVLKETGISEAPDLTKGGGDYVYTRWGAPNSPSRHTQIVISPRAAYRVGTQIHDHDAYGAVAKRSRSWLDIAKVRGGVTEIDVRHGVSLWDDLEVIIASTPQHRANILQALREGGFPEVVRGVPLAERVVAGPEAARAFLKKYPKSVYSWEGTE